VATVTTADTEETSTRNRNPRGEGGRLRDELIAAASELIEESGDADAVTLRGVAKRVGIAAPSIYRHFANVDQLLMAVFDRAFAEFAATRDERRAATTDPGAALLAGCRAYCEFATSHPGPYRFMFSRASPADGSRSGVGGAAFDALVAGIRSCQVAGIATSTEDAALLAAEVWASLHGLALLRLNAPNFPWPAPLERMVEVAVARLVGLDLERIEQNRRAGHRRDTKKPAARRRERTR
jgi:AcrR family transcriptional regulator